MKDDLIKRQDVMKKRNLNEMIAFFNRKVSEMAIPQKYKMELLGMITAIEIEHDELMLKWIPATEALPEEEKEVLCTVIGYPATERVTITDCRYKDGVWQQCIEADYDYWTELTGVVAWMPLPKPWEGE